MTKLSEQKKAFIDELSTMVADYVKWRITKQLNYLTPDMMLVFYNEMIEYLTPFDPADKHPNMRKSWLKPMFVDATNKYHGFM